MEPHSIRSFPRRKSYLAMQRAALAAVEPGAAVRRHVEFSGDQLIVAGRSYDLTEVDRVWVVGGGKAACAMAR